MVSVSFRNAPAGQAVTVLALLTDSEGNETVLRQEDQWLYDLQIEEGDTVVVLEGRLYKRKLKWNLKI